MNVNTTEYEFSHGRKPRGRGNWIFEIHAGSSAPEQFTVYDRPYAEAKGFVVAEARRIKSERGENVTITLGA